jgi:uncharacterized glyoxalase superfamily protein PhnB
VEPRNNISIKTGVVSYVSLFSAVGGSEIVMPDNGRAQPDLKSGKLMSSGGKNSEIKSIDRWGKNEMGGEEGLVKRATFSIDGQEYMVSENTMKHPFTFTPAISIFVECDTEDEQAMLFEKLSENGKVMMELDNYGFSKKFG